MTLLSLVEYEGEFSLEMSAGKVPSADEVVASLGHEPNGYFWEGIAALLLDGSLAEYGEDVEFNSEGGAFFVHSPNRHALEMLGAALSALLADPNTLRAMIEAAVEEGFEFDD